MILGCVVIVCITALTITQMVFSHKEKMAEISAKSNPFNNLFKNLKNQESEESND